ncbi:MAG: hypothetical protein MZU95_03420 [Desulfomicrobium escambiense]|nr:hypothetical protein [Desulfomicrobium escambiense]
MLKKPGVFVVAPVGSIDTDRPPILAGKGRFRSQPEPRSGHIRPGVHGLHQQHGDPGAGEDEKSLEAARREVVFINLQPRSRRCSTS